jgi:hypothetical protein
VPENEPNDILNRLPEVRARNLLILPNDNGKFRPNYNLLLSGSSATYTGSSSPLNRYQNDFGGLNLGRVSLRNVIPPSSQGRYNALLIVSGGIDDIFEADRANTSVAVAITNDVDGVSRSSNETAYAAVIRQSQLPLNGLGNPYTDLTGSEDARDRSKVADNVNTAGSFFANFSRGLIPSLVKKIDTNPNDSTGPLLTVPFLLGEFDSQEMYFFNVPNLYYGDRIEPDTFLIVDDAVSGSGGRVSLTLKDDQGALYRQDCTTPAAKWNDVGNLFHDEGVVVVKSPLLPHFHQTQHISLCFLTTGLMKMIKGLFTSPA